VSGSNSARDRLQLGVVGGGVSGLTAAYRLAQLLPEASVDLFESDDRLGGVLSTQRGNEFLLERGADSFHNKHPWAAELCEELGIAGELQATNAQHRRAFVLRAGQLHPVPEGFVLLKPHRIGPILKTPLLSWRGKIRLLAERWTRQAPEVHHADYDESLASFATRRLGKETFERLVQPLVAGIFTADSDKLSVAATMPDALEAEREHGSLWRSATAVAAKAGDKQQSTESQASGARYSSFLTLSGGIGRLIDALATRIPAERIHLNSPVHGVIHTEDGAWKLVGPQQAVLGEFDGVIIATPAPRAAGMIEQVDPHLSLMLRRISYASSAVVCMVFERDQIRHPLDGFGVVLPAVENREIVAVSFSSVKFSGRAPAGKVLVRVFLGGALQPEKMQLTDEELKSIALSELNSMLGITGEPQLVDIARWHEKMPQYHIGHVQLVDAIEYHVAQIAHLELAGNAYRGVGIPNCIHSGDTAARRLADSFQPSRSMGPRPVTT